MRIMGFDNEEQMRVLMIVASVLHIGNLRFQVAQGTHRFYPFNINLGTYVRDKLEPKISGMYVDILFSFSFYFFCFYDFVAF